MPCDQPLPPIPEPLRGSGGSSFTYESITRRLPEIANHMLAGNEFRPEVVAAVERLIKEIPAGQIRPLKEPGAPDAAEWAGYVAPYEGQNWLEVPWFFAETYFYRRILEATGYFRPGFGREVDPFRGQKRQGLSSALRAMKRRPDPPSGDSREADDQDLASHLLLALWGNQADLSMWPGVGADPYGRQGPDEGGGTDQQSSRILVDDTPAVTAYLSSRSGRLPRVEFLADNAGHELVADLRLAAYLLRKGLAGCIVFHLKVHPTFVSDATIDDVRESIAALAGAQGMAARLGRELQTHLDADRLSLVDHPFWTSPLAMWEMPPTLKQALAKADLLVCKGDANYRRLLGDRDWSHLIPFGDIVCYLPVPLVALRTLKSEVAAGLRPGQPEAVAQKDPDWLIDGHWGVIQFTDGGRSG